MATSGMDRRIKIWDIRRLVGPLNDYKLRTSPRSMVFSQTGCLAVAINNVVDVNAMMFVSFQSLLKCVYYFRYMKNVVKKL